MAAAPVPVQHATGEKDEEQPDDDGGLAEASIREPHDDARESDTYKQKRQAAGLHLNK